MSARPRRVWALGALLPTMVLAGCFSEHTTTTVDDVSFAADVAPLLNGGCAFSGCHGTQSPNPSGKPMVLTTAQAYDQIVNVSSAQLPSQDRIEPGSPSTSYLIRKLEGTHLQPPAGSGSRMPLGANPLSADQIAMLRAWVTQGAQRN
jgi:hypothetical protein